MRVSLSACVFVQFYRRNKSLSFLLLTLTCSFPFLSSLQREREGFLYVYMCMLHQFLFLSLSLCYMYTHFSLFSFSLSRGPLLLYYFFLFWRDRIIIFIQYFLLLSYCPIPHSDFLFPGHFLFSSGHSLKTLFPFTLLLLLLLSYCSYAVPLRISLTLA